MLANSAVPVLFPVPGLALVALVPVVGIETLFLRPKHGFSLRQVFTANCISTLVGIPIACLWGLLCNIIIDEHTGGWGTTDLISRASLTDPDALCVLSVLTLGVIIPCFALSVLIEGRYLLARNAIAARRPFWRDLIKAHCYSYLVLLVVNCMWYVATMS